jgi:hypothetical protein
MAQADYGTKVISELGTHEYRVFFSMFLSNLFTGSVCFSHIVANKNGDLISPLNDIPLWVDKANSIANMVVEIPRGTHPKLEMNITAPLTPIKQDVKVVVSSSLLSFSGSVPPRSSSSFCIVCVCLWFCIVF